MKLLPIACVSAEIKTEVYSCYRAFMIDYIVLTRQQVTFEMCISRDLEVEFMIFFFFKKKA